MNCEPIQIELLTYHFGVIEDGPRRKLEEHLLNCPECLRVFIDLKRDIETAESAPCPSSAVLERLRTSARRELGLPEPRPWSWWERPLAFGLAGVVVLVEMAAIRSLARGSDTAQDNVVAPTITSSAPGSR